MEWTIFHLEKFWMGKAETVVTAKIGLENKNY